MILSGFTVVFLAATITVVNRKTRGQQWRRGARPVRSAARSR
jgi:hypothetical protein